jgi:hypothetical protein
MDPENLSKGVNQCMDQDSGHHIFEDLDPNAIQKNLLVQGSIESKEPVCDDV